MTSKTSIASQNRYSRLFLGLFAGLLLIAPLYFQPNLGGEGLLIPYNILIWLGCAFIISLGTYRALRSRQLVLPHYFRWQLPLIAAITITAYLQPVYDPTAWLFRSAALWGGTLFFLALHQFDLSTAHKERCLYMVTAAALIQALIGWAQLTFPAADLAWLPEGHGRPVGIFQQINVAASFQATALAITGYLISRPSFTAQPATAKLLLILVAFSAAALILASASRAGLLGAIAALAILFAARGSQLLRRKKLLAVWILSMSAGVLAGARFEPPKNALEKLGQPVESSARGMIYGASLDLIRERVIFGYGAGSFERVFQTYKPEYLAQHPQAPSLTARVSHPHNELLYWQFEGGVLPVIGILICVAGFVVLLFRLGWRRGGAYCALIIPIALHTQVEYPFYVSALSWLLFLFLLYYAATHRTSRLHLRLSPLTRTICLSAVILLPTGAALFLTDTLLSYRALTRFAQAQVATELREDLRSDPLIFADNPLQMPVDNWYFSQLAEHFRMHALLQQATAAPNTAALEAYREWALDKLSRSAHAAVYGGLALALQLLGDRAASDLVLEEGLRIYPTSAVMAQYKALTLEARAKTHRPGQAGVLPATGLD